MRTGMDIIFRIYGLTAPIEETFLYVYEFNLPRTVIELDTSMDNNQTRAILRKTVRVVYRCLVFSGFLIPK